MSQFSIADLMVQLQSSDVKARRSSAEHLAQQGAAGQPAVGFLVNAAGDEDEVVREWAVSALESLTPNPDQVDSIASHLGSTSQESVYWAVTLLGRCRERASSAVKSLVDVLTRHSALAVRQQAAWALGMIGNEATPSIPALRVSANDNDPRLKRLAQEAIEKIQKK